MLRFLRLCFQTIWELMTGTHDVRHAPWEQLAPVHSGPSPAPAPKPPEVQPAAELPANLVDCSAAPAPCKGLKPVDHRPGGTVDLDAARIELIRPPTHADGHSMTGHEVIAALAVEPMANAVLLDYYLAHPERIPAEWEKTFAFFLGTTYKDKEGAIRVRGLIKTKKKGWIAIDFWLDLLWSSHCHIVVVRT